MINDITSQLMEKAAERSMGSWKGQNARKERVRETLRDIVELGYVLVPKADYEEFWKWKSSARDAVGLFGTSVASNTGTVQRAIDASNSAAQNLERGPNQSSWNSPTSEKKNG